MLTLKEIVEKRRTILEETVKYYSEDTKRRCIANKKCYYTAKFAGKESNGCAIGRLLPPEVSEAIDILYSSTNIGSDVGSVWKHIPLELQVLGQDFFKDLQGLHDDEDYWDESGLTQRGTDKVQQIREKYVEIVM